MKYIYPLFINTIQKELRNKGLIFLAVITALIIFLGHAIFHYVLSEVLVENLSSMKTMASEKFPSILFSVIGFWTAILAVILGSDLIRSDILSGVFPIILTFPIKKSDYLISRIFGLWFIVLGYFLFSFLLSLISLYLLSGPPDIELGFILGLFLRSLIILSYIVITAIFSVFLNRIFSLISVTFLSLGITYANYYFVKTPLNEIFQSVSFYKVIGFILHYIFPPVGSLHEMATASIYSGQNDLSSLPGLLLHTTLSLLFFFFVLREVLERKDW